MEDRKAPLNEATVERYDAADRPFDFFGEEGETVLICEPDPAVREKIGKTLQDLGYQATMALSAMDALKTMRFHLFDVIVVNELFDTANPEANDVLRYLENLNMSTRRKIFVAMVGARCRTMDNMTAFNRSVNIVIHVQNIEDVGRILKRGVAEHKAFYHVFQKTLQEMGKA